MMYNMHFLEKLLTSVTIVNKKLEKDHSFEDLSSFLFMSE